MGVNRQERETINKDVVRQPVNPNARTTSQLIRKEFPATREQMGDIIHFLSL